MTQNSTNGTPIISKSRFLEGLQCAKLLWSRSHAPHLIPAPDAQTQAIFDQGRQVGELAKRLFPGGIEIGKNVDVTNSDGILTQSQQALNARRPLYEAGFSSHGGFARSDVLNPAANGAWSIVEVKSTTTVEEVHLHDLAFQLHVLTGAGLRIERCVLAHINPAFVKNGPIDAQSFFFLQNVTAQVSALTRSIESKLEGMFSTIRLPQVPEIQIGRHCDMPHECPLHDHCWRFLPHGSVAELYRGGAKRFRLLAKGITKLTHIPDDFPLTSNQAIQRRTAMTGKPHVDKAAIKTFLNQLQYPISFLDFETIGVPAPLFNGVRPYQQVPFQFSLHVVRSPGTEPEHFKFLAVGTDDPRPEFMSRLRDALPTAGSVVAFNASFELGRLKECCEPLPEFSPWVRSVRQRIVDLLLPFRGFRYYHPKQAGSASMKAVLPALTRAGYDHLAIRDGIEASLEFLRVTFGNVSAEERAAVRQQLDDYCGLDTMGMVWIVQALRQCAE